MFHFVHFLASHHEGPADVGLENSIKGTLRKGAELEGKYIRSVAKAALVVPGALHPDPGMRVVRFGTLRRCTRRVKHFLQLEDISEVRWVARMVHFASITLQLKWKHTRWM